jgi:hypothetical protein
MQQIVRNASKKDCPQLVMVLTHLTATQPQLTELPKSVVKVSPPTTPGLQEQRQSNQERDHPALQNPECPKLGGLEGREDCMIDPGGGEPCHMVKLLPRLLNILAC